MGSSARASRSAIGSEEGYVLAVAEFTALLCPRPRFHVQVFDLGHDDIDGLLGLNFLDELHYEVRSAEHLILVEQVEPTGRSARGAAAPQPEQQSGGEDEAGGDE
jgi:hypothetical protein